MRRAVLALAGTAAGLALLLSFKTTPLGSPGPPGAGRAPAAPTSGSRGTGQPVTGRAVTGPAGGRREVTGPAVPTQFGAVQVRVSLAHGRITGVRALLMPHDFALSQQISAYAGPLLRREVLHAQSAHINTVSGATYTSAGYRQSLQAALDKASG